MATLAAVTHLPALALLGEDGRLERSTEPFRRWYEDKEELCVESAELKRVLEGHASAAVLRVDGIAIDIAAMADRTGGRHVLLTLPTGELPSLGDRAGRFSTERSTKARRSSGSRTSTAATFGPTPASPCCWAPRRSGSSAGPMVSYRRPRRSTAPARRIAKRASRSRFSSAGSGIC